MGTEAQRRRRARPGGRMRRRRPGWGAFAGQSLGRWNGPQVTARGGTPLASAGRRGLSARSGRACSNKRDLPGERAGAFLRPRPSAGPPLFIRGTGGSSVPTSQGGGQELRLRAGVNSTVCVSRFQFLIFSLLYLYTVRADFFNAGIKKYIYIYIGVYSGRPLHMLHVPRRD